MALAIIDRARRLLRLTARQHDNGDVIVIGPRCIATPDRAVISWEGVNYVPQPEPRDA
jgi:hypothetical protein